MVRLTFILRIQDGPKYARKVAISSALLAAFLTPHQWTAETYYVFRPLAPMLRNAGILVKLATTNIHHVSGHY